MIHRYIILFLNILDTLLRLIEKKVADLSKNMAKMSRAIHQIVSSSGAVVRKFLLSISFAIGHYRSHIILIIIEISILNKHFQIKWEMIMKLFLVIIFTILFIGF
jgi:hypothetical protein